MSGAVTTRDPTAQFTFQFGLGIRQWSYVAELLESRGRGSHAGPYHRYALMPWIGCGEYLFPPSCFIPLQPWAFSEWWFDDFAVQSWKQYREEVKHPTRAGWVFREQARITESRLALYSDKWLQLVPYWHDLRFGTDNTDGILAQNATDLKTILFTVFCRPEWQRIARRQAAKYPTWCGCEGPYNLVENARKAKKLGMQGVICGILWPDYGMTKIEPWVYGAVKQAVDEWSAGTDRLIG
jgi:hypothetical protein